MTISEFCEKHKFKNDQNISLEVWMRCFDLKTEKEQLELLREFSSLIDYKMSHSGSLGSKLEYLETEKVKKCDKGG